MRTKILILLLISTPMLLAAHASANGEGFVEQATDPSPTALSPFLAGGEPPSDGGTLDPITGDCDGAPRRCGGISFFIEDASPAQSDSDIERRCTR